MYSSIYLSVRLFICLSVFVSLYLSICPSVYLSVCLCISLSVYLSVCPSVYLTLYIGYLSTSNVTINNYPPVNGIYFLLLILNCPSAYLSVCLCIPLSVYLSLCLSVCLCILSFNPIRSVGGGQYCPPNFKKTLKQKLLKICFAGSTIYPIHPVYVYTSIMSCFQFIVVILGQGLIP